LGITYMIVGSYASGSYGEPRMTQDIDIVIDLQASQIDALCAAFPPPEFYVSEDAARQALQHRSMFNVLHPDTGTKIDLIIVKDQEHSRQELARRHRVELIPGRQAFAARPEDVIIAKMAFYAEGGSEKHLRDIAGMLKISAADIDRAYIDDWARRLNLMDVWQAVLARVGA
jgi:hypothetical protein